MAEISCPACGSDDLTGSPGRSGAIQLMCGNCSHVWDRVPNQPCPRCGSLDVVRSVYEGWSYDDLEEARADPMAAWEYVEREVFRCRKCYNEWVKSGARRRPPDTPKQLASVAPISIIELWTRLERDSGETFRQIRGGEFRYWLDGRALYPDRTDWQIPRKHFEEALNYLPLKDTTAVQHLFGPSYVYALLMDRRIRQTDW